MKKDEKDGPILKSSLSTLLKRFSKIDVVGNIEKEYSQSVAGQVRLDLVDDNHVVKKARINEEQLDKTISKISDKGISSPIFVISNGERYEIVYPRIVYIAARKLHFENVPVYVLNIDEEEMLMLLASYLRDNKNSSIVEMSLVLNRIAKKYKYSQKEIALLMHLSRSQITNILRLRNMEQWILDDVANNKLSFGHARAISTLSKEEMEEIIHRVYEEGLSVRETEKIVYEIKHDVDYQKEEEIVSKAFKCKTNITRQRVTLIFENEEEKDNFLKKIKSRRIK